MLRIGLTGPSGAGKGVVSSLLARYGIPSIDTDAVYHSLLVPGATCLNDIVAQFGESVLTPDGRLNRRELAAIVFANGHRDDLTTLNRITHRHILDRVNEICREHELTGVTAVLIDAPLLFESRFDHQCDKSLAVLADRKTRLARIIERDGIDGEAAAQRMNAQPADDYYIRHADAVIYNNETPEDLETPLRALMEQWGVKLP